MTIKSELNLKSLHVTCGLKISYNIKSYERLTLNWFQSILQIYCYVLMIGSKEFYWQQWGKKKDDKQQIDLRLWRKKESLALKSLKLSFSPQFWYYFSNMCRAPAAKLWSVILSLSPLKEDYVTAVPWLGELPEITECPWMVLWPPQVKKDLTLPHTVWSQNIPSSQETFQIHSVSCHKDI